jgi:ribosomal protein S18 acetylase RimI-like enzyme
MPKRARRSVIDVRIRPARIADLDTLLALERALFSTDRVSRRSLRSFIKSGRCALVVAESAKDVAGYALVLFRRTSRAARLYSIGVARPMTGRGIGTALLAAAEKIARGRGCTAMRLEAQDHNTAAISRYESAGYRFVRRVHDYYEDGGDALRFEKPLVRARRASR